MTTKQKYSTLDDNVKVAMGRKNLLINGDFSVWQRDDEFLGLTNESDTFSSDRWRWDERGFGTAVQDLTRSTDAPSGFLYSCKIECTSSGTSGVYYLQQKIEGVDAYVTGWDKVSGKKDLVVSFWLKCSKVGKLGGCITDSSETYGFPFDVTVSSANDWERHEVKITAPPVELDLGVNGTGLVVQFALANDDNAYSDVSDVWVDSIYALHTSNDASISIDQTGDTLKITGVQFELGSVATEFEYVSETDQLARCQRYFERIKAAPDQSYQRIGAGFYDQTNMARVILNYGHKRDIPTISISSYLDFMMDGTPANPTLTGFSVMNTLNRVACFQTTVANSGPAGQGALFAFNNNNGYIDIDAEL
jgi:hypothetical protein